MAKLILKSPYLKCGGSDTVSGYMKYIATRENVQILTDNRPVTKRQEQLIRSITKDFPETKELFEYEDWQTTPTKAHASAFITSALELNWDAAGHSDVYMKYIATRPRAERLGDHGLFGDSDAVDLDKAMAELDAYTGNVWTHIIRLMFQDEAGFGRINKPKYCWCRKGLRPTVPCHHIREYRYAYGAVEPQTGQSFFLVMPYCNTDCMNIFLQGLSKEYSNDYLLLVVDGASWHKAKGLEIPNNIELFFLPPATPEMNPIEQVWAWLRLHGFRNEIFQTLDKVVDRLCDTICSLSLESVKSITHRKWILPTC